jgi:acyl dehydratase
MSLEGHKLGVGDWVSVTQDMVNTFAGLTGDDQYIHVNPERAKASAFGGTIAHGFLTLSLLPLLGRSAWDMHEVLPHTTAVNVGINKVRFISPVRIPSELRVDGKILSERAVAEDCVELVIAKTVELRGIEKPALYAEIVERFYK